MKSGFVMGAVLCALAMPTSASAFCGFYVGGAEASLYNDATMVVLMRQGTRTVLAMQNTYQGPPERFAMVVPVPVVLQRTNVKTLEREVFARVDRLAAPRLVEYWERDPCAPLPLPHPPVAGGMRTRMLSGGGGGGHGVRIEAQFAVGEYDIVILSASDSSGLDRWLREQHYHIPANAEPALRPYVQAGTKFFVARVDPRRVTFQNGRAVLSPLRVHYDSDTFNLPVRLGLINSHGTQDLIVHILALNQRYETANFPNVFIPTNIEVRNAVRGHFGEFYATLFDATRAANPGAVVTEYAWQANSCDPCPGPVLSPSDIATLGGDVVGSSDAMGWTLTRLHYRYDRNGLSDDLVFRAAPPMVGGRGVPDAQGRMTSGASPSSENNFQGRYVILHRWNRPLHCANPHRGMWGGPPDGSTSVEPALDLATQRRGSLSSFVSRPIPGLARPRPRARARRPRKAEVASSPPYRAAGFGAAFLIALGAGAFLARSRKRRP